MAKALAKLQGLGHKVRRDEWQECRILQVDLPAPSSVDIEFKNITLTVSEGLRAKKKKTILKEISGRFRSGEVTAIMGPSGAGKSSLMNALTGFSTKGVTGTIRAGDSICELGKKQKSLHNLKAYRKKSCYIMQDDRLNPLFTVGEAMKFAADMKLGNSLTDKIKMTVINEVLGTLGLLGTEGTRCGHLSGGQKKRLSIALELIDNPPVVFLDEPTTGLDSLSSMQCIQMLKNLARDGRTIVCSVHQPQASAYEMFDQVYILANGVTVYQGSSANTVPFLASIQLHCPKYHNPADFVMEVANGEYGDYNDLLAEECRRRDWTKEPQMPVASTGKQGFILGKTTVAIRQPHEFYKFNVLLKRCLIQQYRDWTVCHLKIALHIFTGVVLGVFFWQCGGDGSKTFNNLGFLIISCVYLCYTTVMPAVLRFPLELNVLRKENFNNWYDLKTYYAAVLFTSIPIQIWYCIVYSTPSYFLSGQPIELSRFSMYVLVLTMLTLLADAMGSVIGAVANPVNGTFFGAIITCAMLVFSGFLALLSHMNTVMRTISYASFIKYGLEGLVLAVYSYGRKPLICPPEKLYCHLRYPKEILKEFSFKPDNYWIDILVLFAGMVTLRVIAYFTLKRFVKKSR